MVLKQKRCLSTTDPLTCARCDKDKVTCSFGRGDDTRRSQLPAEEINHPEEVGLRERNRAIDQCADSAPALPTPFSEETLLLQASNVPVPDDSARYATMFELVKGRRQDKGNEWSSSKLIGDTNPLSALLRPDLKHKIVTRLCAFRSPEPATGWKPPGPRRLTSASGWDWESQYAATNISPARMSYLKTLGCFQVFPPECCGRLLDTYFAYVHPQLPIVDKKDFLSHYYGHGEAPSLLILTGIFLAASRYQQGEGSAAQSRLGSDVRERCETLHGRLRALIDVDATTDRLATLQASILASLHWEGREGVNCAVDSLSLSVRLCQEMGLHRMSFNDTYDKTGFGNDLSKRLLGRRIWWVVYTLDRFNAAQEGVPFIINELDCDVDRLKPADLVEEDAITRSVTIHSLCLALLIQDTVRTLYTPGRTLAALHSGECVAHRDRLNQELNTLRTDITLAFEEDSIPGRLSPDDQRFLWLCLLHVHANAIGTLINRPFQLLREPANGLADEAVNMQYSSRIQCHRYATNTISLLCDLAEHGSLQYSWPFTVYATVNSLLICWHAMTTPQYLPDQEGQSREANFTNFLKLIDLLRDMGLTWWAAAAKHKLAEALWRAAFAISVEQGHTIELDSGASSWDLEPGFATPSPSTAEVETTTHSSGEPTSQSSDLPDNLWSSIDLDFEADVLKNIFGIL